MGEVCCRNLAGVLLRRWLFNMEDQVCLFVPEIQKEYAGSDVVLFSDEGKEVQSTEKLKNHVRITIHFADSTVMAKLRRDGHELQFTSPDVRNTGAYVLAAVGQDGSALVHASAEMRRNAKIVTRAVDQMMRAGFVNRARILVEEYAPEVIT